MVEKNKEYILDIISQGYEGEGIAKINDTFPIFIEGALKGEKVNVKIVKSKKNFAYAKLINVIEPSKERCEPICKINKRCGGCKLQHSNYSEQLNFKFERVKDCISKIGKLDDSIVKFPLGMKEPWRYRNKVQLPIGMVNGELKIGFFAPRSHEIIDMESCLIQDEIADKIVELTREWIKKNNIKPYNVDGKYDEAGILRHIMIRRGFTTNEVMVVLVANGTKLPHLNELASVLQENIPGFKTLVLNINKDKTNVILGKENKVIYGNGKINDYIGDLVFEISPLSFFQVNPVQTEVLYNKALEYAELKENDTVFDIYCGIGSISLFLAQKATKVYGIEIVEDAIKDAKINAKLNNLNNVEFYVGKAEEVVPKMYSEGKTANVVVVDPPRKGCDEKVLDTIVSMKPDRVVYVSCNPSTLARDLAYLDERGYKCVEIQPVDMFPHTMHVECCALMS
ncbi:23S rRNA (uracil(1939)-C(5))-methyltransferase RlmD, partial [uncultured Clostridium sp.]|uniref:23S rRNA (uracil(1939)-C(5))-methyltransferase RlmD n=1 Tax=uncultured Clostridium sp. TaxID=59620 RepID=UPI00262D5D0F